MNPVAVALVLVAAVVHPAWNLLAKRATGGDAIAFVWLTSALSAALYVPIVVPYALAAHGRPPHVPLSLAMVAGTGVLHVAYFALLQYGYRASEFSFVYPLARGSAPVFAACVAVGALGERLDALQIAGIALVVVAIVVIARAPARERPTVATAASRTSLAYGLATGLAIAAYTLWDKEAVAAFAIPPLLYDFGRTSGQAILLAPVVLGSRERRAALRTTWAAYRGEAVGVAILSPLAYVLILYALASAPVSLVAPLRETSIVVGAFFGARVLREGRPRRRIVAAALMLVGIFALARG